MEKTIGLFLFDYKAGYPLHGLNNWILKDRKKESYRIEIDPVVVVEEEFVEQAEDDGQSGATKTGKGEEIEGGDGEEGLVAPLLPLERGLDPSQDGGFFLRQKRWFLLQKQAKLFEDLHGAGILAGERELVQIIQEGDDLRREKIWRVYSRGEVDYLITFQLGTVLTIPLDILSVDRPVEEGVRCRLFGETAQKARLVDIPRVYLVQNGDRGLKN